MGRRSRAQLDAIQAAGRNKAAAEDDGGGGRSSLYPEEGVDGENGEKLNAEQIKAKARGPENSN